LKRTRSVVLGSLLSIVLVAQSLPAAGATDIRGSWIGVIREIDGDSGFQAMSIVITRLQVGTRAGRVVYANGECRGPITLRSRTARGTYFFAYHEVNDNICSGDDRIRVRLRGARLSVRVVPPPDRGYNVHEGLLRRDLCVALPRRRTARMAC
jgi:hypothetical protein